MKLEKRKKILKAAEVIIQKKRFHEVVVDDIAKEAGVGKGTIYRYFESKEDLFYELALTGFSSMEEDMEKLVKLDIPYDEKFYKLTQRMQKFFRQRFSVIKVIREIEDRSFMLTEQGQSRLMGHRKAVRDQITLIMKEGLKKNRLLMDLSPVQYAEFWIHQLIGLNHWAPDVPKIKIEKIIKAHLKEGK